MAVVLLGAAPGLSAAAARVRVATFNVYNYLAMDRQVEGQYRPDYPKPEREKAAVRAVLHEVQADIVALQEMGGAPYLEELRRDLAREGLDYPNHALLEAGDHERHVAVLSRVPFSEVTPHPDITFAYLGARERVKRGLLEVVFSSPAGPWTLFVVHLKSRLTERPDDPLAERRRTGEAQALRDLVLERRPDPATMPFLVVGDCNATPDSPALARFRHRGATGITVLLPAADARGETWTERYARADSYTRVDYLLASAALLPHVPGGRGVIHDGDGALGGSDHRLVYVDLEFAAPAPGGGARTVTAPGP